MSEGPPTEATVTPGQERGHRPQLLAWGKRRVQRPTVAGSWQALRELPPRSSSSTEATRPRDPSQPLEVTELPLGFVFGTHFNCFHFASFISFCWPKNWRVFREISSRLIFQRCHGKLGVAEGGPGAEGPPLNPGVTAIHREAHAF